MNLREHIGEVAAEVEGSALQEHLIKGPAGAGVAALVSHHWRVAVGLVLLAVICWAWFHTIGRKPKEATDGDGRDWWI